VRVSHARRVPRADDGAAWAGSVGGVTSVRSSGPDARGFARVTMVMSNAHATHLPGRWH
jgi:hypothetical protein